MTFLNRTNNILAKIEGWLIVVFLSLMVIFTFIQVCLRALYTHAHIQWANTFIGYMDWSDPFVRLLVLWMTFIGASLVTRENRHIKIDLFGAFLPKKWLPVRDFIMCAFCVTITAVMVKVCITYVKMEMAFGGTLFGNFPIWAGELIIPVGFCLILFRFLIRTMDLGLEIFRGLRQ